MNKNNLNFSVIFLSHPPSTIAISVQDISALIDNGRRNNNSADIVKGDQKISSMKFEEIFVVHGSGKQRIRPSNWIERLMDIVAAHRRGREKSNSCGTCCQCPNTQCFIFPLSLHQTHPGLAHDLLFSLHMIEAPDLSTSCPRNAVPSSLDQQSAA